MMMDSLLKELCSNDVKLKFSAIEKLIERFQKTPTLHDIAVNK